MCNWDFSTTGGKSARSRAIRWQALFNKHRPTGTVNPIPRLFTRSCFKTSVLAPHKLVILKEVKSVLKPALTTENLSLIITASAVVDTTQHAPSTAIPPLPTND